MLAKKLVSKLVGFGVLVGMLGGAIQASAEKNGVVVIMDQTGSMLSNLTTGGVTDPTYVWARDLADDRVGAFVADREFELWSFGKTAADPDNLIEVLFDFEDGEAMSVANRQTAVLDQISLLPVPLSSTTTPLASTLCAAVDEIIDWASATIPPPEKRIMVFTDGHENATDPSDQCYGPSSTVDYDPLSTDCRGGLDVGSWQWKVLNKALTGDANNSICPVPAPLQVIVDVNALFDYVGSYAGATTENIEGGGGFYSPMSASDAAFFQGLAESTGGQYVQVDPVTPPPVTGDANGDGCVGYPDYMQVISQYGPVTSANQASDLNNDQVVDYYDVLVIIQHWATPC